MRLEAISASGPFLARRAASSSATVDGRAGLGEAVDDAELVEALGGQRVAGERELHDHVVGHPPGQAQQRAAGGDQRALGLGDAQLGALGGDDQVAGERDLHAAGDGEALDRGDQRLARGALGDAGEAAVAEPGRLAADERAQVHAGAEEAAGAGEHADRQRVVAVELVQRARDARGDGGVDGVAHLGAVERDQQDVAAPLGEHGGSA